MDIDLAAYTVSRTHGFLTPQPVQRLSDPYYAPWESLAADLSDLIKNDELEQRLKDLPVLSTDRLQDENQWMRAHSLLAFASAAHVWGRALLHGGQANDKVPTCIAKPFLSTCEHLGILPTTTYASTATMNWTVPAGTILTDFSDPEQLECLNTFTGTEDEAWFYLMSVAIESLCGKCVGTVLDAMQAVQDDDPQEYISRLQVLAEQINAGAVLLGRMYERCRPDVFYHDMRPFWAGYKGTEKAGALLNGIHYDLGNGSGTLRKHDGGSAAQSPIFHFLDISLGVRHLTGRQNTKEGLEAMRNLMPAKHRDFLKLLEGKAKLRQYAQEQSMQYPQVRIAYNQAIDALTGFRDAHIRMATKYISETSRMPSHAHAALVASTPPRLPTPEPTSRPAVQQTPSVGAANMSDRSATATPAEAVRGTGGTPFIQFLKQSRDETKAAGKNGYA